MRKRGVLGQPAMLICPANSSSFRGKVNEMLLAILLAMEKGGGWRV
jgi:hypothetical protein